MKKNIFLGALLLATAWSCTPAPAQELLTHNASPWEFFALNGTEPPTCVLQVQGFTHDGLPGPLLVLQWKDGQGDITVTYDNIDKDLMTIYNASGSAFARMVVASFDVNNPDQASFVPDFPIAEVFSAAHQISFASDTDPNTPYAFIMFDETPFNSLENWSRCATLL